ncbi:selenoprotein M-like [Aethina tumida]|uniref:selenoprotein M-like n=1 Tax=Aethina tumida TaxID=116153 RepID=UPI00096B0165|nr:selenoprotein M-like [Aethina tumida]
MGLKLIIPLLGLLFLNVILCDIVKVRLESCPGCSLNRLHDVKKFFYEDVPLYDNVEWKKIGGAPPEAIFLDENEVEVERHLLGRLTRSECNQLLESKGFKKKDSKEL